MPRVAVALTIAGAALEVVGFALIALKLWLIERREFGMPPWIARALRALGIRRARVVDLGAALSGESALRAHFRVERPPGGTLEERVTRLEAEHADLENELVATRQELEADLDKAAQRINQRVDRLEEERAQANSQAREQLRQTQRLEWWGTGLFVVGVVATTGGAIAS